MPNLNSFVLLAESQNFDVTSPLTFLQTRLLLNVWLPEVRFFEEELFHPVTLDRILREPLAQFETLGEDVKSALRMSIGDQLVDPPAIHVSDGSGGRQVLNANGASIDDALEALDLDETGVITHGADFNTSKRFFGSTETIAGQGAPLPGDPMAPRYPVVVGGEVRMLLETLKFELETAQSPLMPTRKDDLPLDAVRGGFDVIDLLFFKIDGAAVLSETAAQNLVLRLIAAEQANDQAEFLAVEGDLPVGWSLNRAAWNAITKYAFLEYSFLYAYNDYHRYGDYPWVNQHEFDNEGCALVFERRLWEEALENPEPDAALLEVDPVAIITSVHEEWQGGDRFKTLSSEVARDNLVVYVAAGSHATYLQPGNHDLLNAADVAFGLPAQKVPLGALLLIYAAFPAIAIPIALLAVILEHFQDSEDQTSDDGVRIGPTDEAPVPDDRHVGSDVEITPLSADRTIYQRELRRQLRSRCFGGKWGAHDSSVNHSPPYINKTGRYFRALLRAIGKEQLDPTPIG